MHINYEDHLNLSPACSIVQDHIFQVLVIIYLFFYLLNIVVTLASASASFKVYLFNYLLWDLVDVIVSCGGCKSVLEIAEECKSHVSPTNLGIYDRLSCQRVNFSARSVLWFVKGSTIKIVKNIGKCLIGEFKHMLRLG